MSSHAALTRARRTAQRAPDVLSEPVFRSVLIRERRRAERSHRGVVVILVASAGCGDAAPPWSAIIDRLAATLDATDVLGWYETGAVIGIVRPWTRPDAPPPAPGTPPGDGRLSAGLEQIARAYSVRLLIYPDPAAGSSESGHFDPTLHPELAVTCRSERLGAAAKRGIDVMGSVLLLLALAPVLAVIASLVKLSSPGPALFKQTRLGHLARPFTVRKFRTMHVHADAAVHREFVSQFIGASGRPGHPPIDGLFKLTNDRRITPLGRFLRKSSLDELPQLWNVLRGEMSLVGPRPPVPYEYAEYQPWHRRRIIEAKPGLTGLWQVTGRSRTTFDEMVRLDLRYARTRSLGRDLAIICRTPFAVISGKGAC